MSELEASTRIVGENAKTITEIKPGATFHGLFIHSILGKGAMGSAYLASHPLLRTPLVVKTFNTTVENNIFKEAHLAARVNSANVVNVNDAGIEGGIPFVIQRYVDGIDLAELIKHIQKINSRLPVNLVCQITIDAAMGLHAIHQAGVIHRDVKPANLFLSGNGVTTVGDFGIAVDVTKDETEPSISGTPIFMAPEQWAMQRVDRQTDIYSLGATAHLLATGQAPFAADDWRGYRNAHLSSHYTPPPAREPAEAYLFSVIERMLRKDPLARYQTGEEVARILRTVVEAPPTFIRRSNDETRVGNLECKLIIGDLSAQSGDVLVNAANTELFMRVGVARALKQAGGVEIETAAMAQGPVAMGDVVWTGAGSLPARWIAHAVSALNGAICLQRAILRVLLGAEERQARSILLPALGTGVGEVPMDLAAKLTFEALRTFATLQPKYVRDVRIVLFDENGLSRWRTILKSI